MTELETFRIRCAEAEKALKECYDALELVPIEEIEKGLNWLPSEIAIHLLRRAKTCAADFDRAHWNTDERS